MKDVSIESGKVKVTTDKGVSDLFDAVVLTMPVPQILQLQGDIQKMIGRFISDLVKDVSMVSGKLKVTTDKGVSDLFDAVILTMPVPQILQLQGDIQALIGRFIWDLGKDNSIESGKVKVTTDKGVSDLFDAVVLTMPVPQILQLQGDIKALIGRFISDIVMDVSMVSEKVKVTTDNGVSDLFDAVILTMPVPQILQLQGDIQALIGRFIWDLVKDVSMVSGKVKVTTDKGVSDLFDADVLTMPVPQILLPQGDIQALIGRFISDLVKDVSMVSGKVKVTADKGVSDLFDNCCSHNASASNTTASGRYTGIDR